MILGYVIKILEQEMQNDMDDEYLALIRKNLEVCSHYCPKFGQGGKKGLSFDDFQQLYDNDPFYHWFGLSTPAFYSAHRVAGGITSVYRQIGLGMESVFRKILQDQLGQTEEESCWSYEIPDLAAGSKSRKLSLDGRILPDCIKGKKRRVIIQNWIQDAKSIVGGSLEILGVVFECRQGYKSKDSKRQNADIANASSAYKYQYLPCVITFSQQIDSDIVQRYRKANWLVLTGSLNGSPHESTYVFIKDILGYDLAGFFERNQQILRDDVDKIIHRLLD